MQYPDAPRPRRRWGCFFFIVFVVVIAGALFFLLPDKPQMASGTILEVNVGGVIPEGPATNPFEALTRMGMLSLWDLRMALTHAAKDPNVSGLKIVLEPLDSGEWGAIEELRDLILEFRKSKKPVHIFLRPDILQEVDYYLALTGDKIWLSPESGALLNGMQATATFFKGTFEKLKIEPNVMMFKEYKSAGEPFGRKEMSQHYREALHAVLSDIYDRFIAAVAERRGVSLEEVKADIDRGMMSTQELLKDRWVDALGYGDEVNEALKTAVGTKEYQGMSLGRYLDHYVVPEVATDQIAVIFGEGPILASQEGDPFSGSSIQGPEVAKTFHEAIENKAVKAIVFRVNSPGGSAVGSDLIWREIENAKKQKKPVIVSMSSVAGSGGYWVSMGADKIVARHTTITGSIGVVGMKLNLKGFYEWLGTNVDTSVTFGKNADLWSPFASWSESQKEAIKAWMGEIYGHFIEKVSKGRNLDPAKVEEIAKGRIWSGQDAKDIGLIDDLGGLDLAIQLAREKAGISPDGKVSLVVYPKAKNLLEQILSGEFSLVQMKTYLSKESKSAIERDLDRLRLFESGKVWALMPDIEIH